MALPLVLRFFVEWVRCIDWRH